MNLTGRHTEVPLHRTWGIQFHSIRLTFLENFDTQVLTEQTHLTLQTNKSVGITSRASTPIHATTATSLQPGKNSPSQAMHACYLCSYDDGGWVDVSDLCVSECSSKEAVSVWEAEWSTAWGYAKSPGRVGPLQPFSSMHQQLVEHLREHSHQDTALKGNGERERVREREISGSLLHHIFLLIMTSANLCMFCVSVCVCVWWGDDIIVLALRDRKHMLERMRRQTRSTRTAP